MAKGAEIKRVLEASKMSYKLLMNNKNFNLVSQPLNEIGFQHIGDGAHRLVFGNGEIVTKIPLNETNLSENEKAYRRYKKVEQIEDLKQHVPELLYADTENYRWFIQEQIKKVLHLKAGLKIC